MSGMVAVLTVPTVGDIDSVGGYDCWCCGEPYAGTIKRRGKRVCLQCAYMCAGCAEADKETLATAVLWADDTWARCLCAACWEEEGEAQSVPNPSHGTEAVKP